MTNNWTSLDSHHLIVCLVERCRRSLYYWRKIHLSLHQPKYMAMEWSDTSLLLALGPGAWPGPVTMLLVNSAPVSGKPVPSLLARMYIRSTKLHRLFHGNPPILQPRACCICAKFVISLLAWNPLLNLLVNFPMTRTTNINYDVTLLLESYGC